MRFYKNFLILFLSLFLSNSVYCSSDYSSSNKKINQKDIDHFIKVLNYINSQHIEGIKENWIFEAINGILSSMDSHSLYLEPKEKEDLVTNLEGELGGIGVELFWKEGYFTVVSAIDDMPAKLAGIKSGDLIVAIDDESTNSLGHVKALSKIKGDQGTKVKISVQRVEGQVSKIIDFNIIRKNVVLHPIKYHLDGDILYIKVPVFTKNMYDEFLKVTSKIPNSDVKGILLDLRQNPGGILDQACKLVNTFIKEGVIVSTKGRKVEYNRIYVADPKLANMPDIPLAILIDRGSASASEIVASAIQYYKRGLIIGEKSFGKGSVQNFVELSELQEDTALKVTTSLFYGPDGESIQEKAVTPDIEVVPGISDLKDETRRLDSEALRGNRIKIPKNEDSKLNKDKKPKSIINKTTSYSLEEYRKDNQYSRAIDALKGIIILNVKR